MFVHYAREQTLCWWESQRVYLLGSRMYSFQMCKLIHNLLFTVCIEDSETCSKIKAFFKLDVSVDRHTYKIP